MTSARSMQETGRPKPVLRDNPEGGGGRGLGVQDGGDTWITSADSC